MSHLLLDGISAVGVSRSLKTHNEQDHTVYTEFKSLATKASLITAVVIKLQGSEMNPLPSEVISNPTLAIGSTAERVANAAFDFMIDDVSYSKGEVAAGSAFSEAHTITASRFGIVNIYIDANGDISSLVPGSSQTDAQAYTTASLALAAGEGIVALSGTVKIGHILIENDAGLWTANTDDLTDASDVTTTTFFSETSTFLDIATHTFTGAELIVQKALFHVVNQGSKYTRLYLSTLTGTGEVTATWAQAGIRAR